MIIERMVQSINISIILSKQDCFKVLGGVSVFLDYSPGTSTHIEIKLEKEEGK